MNLQFLSAIFTLFILSAASSAEVPCPRPNSTLPTSNYADLHRPKHFEVKSGLNYSYIYAEAQVNRPTFLLLHGFPSSVFDWRYQINDLTDAGYGVIAPDLLGYGHTDKPTDVNDCCDWGSGLPNKLAMFYPNFFSSYVFVSVPYSPGAFDLDAINQQTEAIFGYPAFGYMKFFNETKAAEVLDQNIESSLSLVYPRVPERWQTDLCPYGTAEEWIRKERFDPLPPWESEHDREYRVRMFREGGFAAPLNWYKSNIRNIDAEDVAKVPPENIVLNKPVLFIGGDQDYATRIEIMQQVAKAGKESFLPDVEVKTVEGTSHWLLLEKPREVFVLLDGFARKLGQNVTDYKMP
ncbi:unnamed protein product [Periconia digitata]|uniref:AB hydrolase-1 domain-containing protein n=1 Tax=Periconia digitata TaxID=1303443 RepID=A0A9W4URK3_9PLEO|nr:unnamed protein product [Periconia digitata]